MRILLIGAQKYDTELLFFVRQLLNLSRAQNTERPLPLLPSRISAFKTTTFQLFVRSHSRHVCSTATIFIHK